MSDRFLINDSVDRTAIESLFEHERSRISHLLPTADIQHIGATSVPGLLTKGDLDITVRVPAFEMPAADSALASLYPRNTGNDRTPTYSSFERATIPSLGVQLCANGGPEDNFITLRDALQKSPAAVAKLNDIKLAWNGKDMNDYRAAKAAFIEDLLRSLPPRH